MIQLRCILAASFGLDSAFAAWNCGRTDRRQFLRPLRRHHRWAWWHRRYRHRFMDIRREDALQVRPFVMPRQRLTAVAPSSIRPRIWTVLQLYQYPIIQTMDGFVGKVVSCQHYADCLVTIHSIVR